MSMRTQASVMNDIVLLRFVGMNPVLVHAEAGDHDV